MPENIKIFFPFAFVTFLFLSSCDSLKNDPSFTGTWQNTEKITTDDLVYKTIRTIKLTKTSFEETFSVGRDNSPDITQIIGTKGRIIMSQSRLTFILEELGTCKPDDSQNCTGIVEWFGQGTQYWNDNHIYFSQTVTGEFEVNGNTLHLTRDLNSDGDYEDAGEDVLFTML